VGMWMCAAAMRLCSSRLASSTKNVASVTEDSLIICGPSGVGKGTIINHLLRMYPDTLELSVSHTTRKPRPNELDGVHYHFIDRTDMEKLTFTNADEFLEYGYVHGNIYGTSYEAIRSIQRRGKLCILDIDTDGVRRIKAKNFPGKYVFIAPPSLEVLQQRLRTRKTETEEQMKLRLANAAEEVKYGTSQNFDCVVVNDSLQGSVALVDQQLYKWFPKIFVNSSVS
jgi:guanylate kinase